MISSEEPRNGKIMDYIILLALIVLITAGYHYFFCGDTIFCADISRDADVQVDLVKDTQYQVWVLDALGPESVEVTIRNGSQTIFKDTFQLMHPEGEYIPYHPGFSVEATGRYNITVRPLDPGTIRIKVQKDVGISPSRISRDISRGIYSVRSLCNTGE
ncbi:MULTISPECIES: hypothetical protein [unclassified Methanoculleus]|jgi:hypothetical protein|nr:hypothetical protein [Methanoculleus sp. UBA377]